jgi:glycosyltransferase involved in cell wall biosynthesis
MPQPFVTVLIDTYNYGRFIEEAIESVLSQNFPPDRVEVMVVDDGSTDDTAGRVKKYAPRVRYFYKANGGQGSAFNFGFANAQGEFVALLDADDYFLPGKLRRVFQEAQSHPEAGMIYHSMLELDAISNSLREANVLEVSGFLPNDKSKLLDYRLYPTSSLVFRRKALDKLLPMPETIKLQADTYVALLIPLVATVLAVSEPLSVYRLHGGNLYSSQEPAVIGQRKQRRIAMLETISREVRAWAKRNGSYLEQPQARLFLRRWLLSFQEEQFLNERPTRIRFFWFLLRQNYTETSEQTWKLTVFNYLSAFSALVFGYKEARRMYEWRGRVMEVLQSMFRGSLRGRK